MNGWQTIEGLLAVVVVLMLWSGVVGALLYRRWHLWKLDDALEELDRWHIGYAAAIKGVMEREDAKQTYRERCFALLRQVRMWRAETELWKKEFHGLQQRSIKNWMRAYILSKRSNRWRCQCAKRARQVRELRREVRMWQQPSGEVRMWDEAHYCGDCGSLLQAVRPGKWQCLTCEERRHDVTA